MIIFKCFPAIEKGYNKIAKPLYGTSKHGNKLLEDYHDSNYYKKKKRSRDFTTRNHVFWLNNIERKSWLFTITVINIKKMDFLPQKRRAFPVVLKENRDYLPR